MRILLLSDINSYHTKKWAIGLSEKGLSISIFSLSEPKTTWFEEHNINCFYKKYSKNNNSIINKLKYLLSSSYLKEVISQVNPNYIHAHYATSYGLLGMLSKFKPFYISLWGSDILLFPKKSFLHKALLSSILKSATRIFSTSKIMAEKALEIANVDAKIIPFGIDISHFKQTNPIDKNHNKITIGICKRMENIAGIDILIKTFSKLVKKHDNINLLIVGNGSMLEKYKYLVTELNIESLVTFTGEISQQELPIYYNKMDIAIFPSRSESFGVSIVEASSCNLPIVASNTGGIPEVVKNKETGFLINSWEDSDTLELISTLINNTSLRNELGNNGRKFVEDNFNFEKNLETMKNYYL